MRTLEGELRTAGRKYRQELETDVFTAARQRMAYVYEVFETVVVSWSGGKDSSVCLELAREAARDALPLIEDAQIVAAEAVASQ